MQTQQIRLMCPQEPTMSTYHQQGETLLGVRRQLGTALLT
jgi:hypothetical protein